MPAGWGGVACVCAVGVVLLVLLVGGCVVVGASRPLGWRGHGSVLGQPVMCWCCARGWVWSVKTGVTELLWLSAELEMYASHMVWHCLNTVSHVA